MNIASYKFDVSDSSTMFISLVASITLISQNPNIVGIKYDFSRLKILNNGLVVGMIRIPEFYQPARSHNVSIQIDILFQHTDISAIVSGAKTSSFPIRVSGDIGTNIWVSLQCDVAVDWRYITSTNEIFSFTAVKNQIAHFDANSLAFSKKCSILLVKLKLSGLVLSTWRGNELSLPSIHSNGGLHYIQVEPADSFVIMFISKFSGLGAQMFKGLSKAPLTIQPKRTLSPLLPSVSLPSLYSSILGASVVFRWSDLLANDYACMIAVDQDVEQYNKLEDPADEENDMLDLAFGLTETSRLGCQVIAKPELDGLRLALPAATRNFAVDGYKPKPH
ncbi:hypothetical protein E3N88_39663 [Mikania micrantha]|uniref:2Fe-2S ferredoxin-type domain-containing protein n=1 Tax=Mikania micrantha TaxID=192012 RepID=A0A5N6LXE9_9ASTR|nr:hypothetical protein E3N88_39663 [Mikania micrantha]